MMLIFCLYSPCGDLATKQQNGNFSEHFLFFFLIVLAMKRLLCVRCAGGSTNSVQKGACIKHMAAKRAFEITSTLNKMTSGAWRAWRAWQPGHGKGLRLCAGREDCQRAHLAAPKIQNKETNFGGIAVTNAVPNGIVATRWPCRLGLRPRSAACWLFYLLTRSSARLAF